MTDKPYPAHLLPHSTELPRCPLSNATVDALVTRMPAAAVVGRGVGAGAVASGGRGRRSRRRLSAASTWPSRTGGTGASEAAIDDGTGDGDQGAAWLLRPRTSSPAPMASTAKLAGPVPLPRIALAFLPLHPHAPPGPQVGARQREPRNRRIAARPAAPPTPSRPSPAAALVPIPPGIEVAPSLVTGAPVGGG